MKRTASIALVATIFLASCGRSGSTPTAKKSPNSSNAEVKVPCTKSSCPAVPMTITANPLQNGSLVGTMGNLTPWVITGVTQGGSDRDIRMAVFNAPEKANISGQGSLNIRIEFTSQIITQGQVPLAIIVRDVSRCKIENPQQIQACENINQKGLDNFEVHSSVPWTIVAGNAEQFVDPTFTSSLPSMPGSQSGFMGCNRGLTEGLLQGVLGGQILGGVIGGVKNCFGNVVGGHGQ